MDWIVPEARRRPGFMWGDILLILLLLLVGYVLLDTLQSGPADTEQTVDFGEPGVAQAILWIAVLLETAIVVGLAVGWLASTRARPLAGAWRWLRMHNESRHSHLFWLGVSSLLAVGLFVAAVLFGILLDAVGADPGGDPTFEAIARVGTWPLMFAFSLTAGINEEILFRGVLQKRLGWAGQAVVFGLAHVNQGWYAVVFIIALSSSFGYLVKRGAPLWSMMWAHTAYDFILFGQLYISVH